MNDIKIVEYKPIYAKDISDIILKDLYTINIKDYNKEFIDSISIYFTEEEIRKNFPNRVKSFVAIKNNKVIGTASIDTIKPMYGVDIKNTINKYLILTVFIDINNLHQGIGRKLIETIEDYSKRINAKELIIPASIHGLEFYRKLGYDYLNGNKKMNKDGEFILSKTM